MFAIWLPQPAATAGNTPGTSNASEHHLLSMSMRLAAMTATALLAGCFNHVSPADPSVESTFPTAAPRPLHHPLHVVTFNTHMIPGERIAYAILADRALRDADLIVLEEVHREGPGCSGACEVARELGMYAAYAPGHVNGKGTDGVAILSRTPISNTEVIELPGYNVVWNGGRRIALAATIKLDGQEPVTVYAVHLENRLNVCQRRNQMATVLDRARKDHGRVIIAGDFNTSPFTWLGHVVPILTTTQDDRLEEFVRANGFDTPVVDSGPTSRFIAMKLDAIYTRGWKTVAFATANAKNVSDHLALWAKLEPASD
jgi:endonuclease/exonuclease/phosphatase family metal-dependent hydrolase